MNELEQAKRGYRRALWTVAAAGAIAATLSGAALFGGVGSAHADDVSFLRTMAADGFTDGAGGSHLLHNGYAVCDALNYANGEVVAHQVWLSPKTDFSSEQVAKMFVVDAVTELCPWQDHSGNAKTNAKV